METILQMITRPQTIEEAEAIIAVLARTALGGQEAVDILYRHEVKQVPARQIARDVGCNRERVGHLLKRFRGVKAEIESARQQFAEMSRPSDWLNRE